MAITIITGGTQAAGVNNGNPVTLTFPTLAENDVVIVFGGHFARGGTTSAVPSGYTTIYDSGNTLGTDPHFAVSYKVMGATPDTSVSCPGSGTATDGTAYGCYCLRGVDTTNIQDATRTVAGPTTSNDPDAPSIITVTNGAMVLALALDHIAGTGDTSITLPSGYGELRTARGADNNDATVAGGALEKTAFGTEDPPSFTGWTAGTWRSATVAVRPLIENTELTAAELAIGALAIGTPALSQNIVLPTAAALTVGRPDIAIITQHDIGTGPFWAATQGTILDDQDGVADKFVPNTSTDNHAFSCNSAFGVAVGDIVTVEIEAKADGYNWLLWVKNGQSARSTFDVATGSLGAQNQGLISRSITATDSGYYLCRVTFQQTVTDQAHFVYVQPTDNAGEPYAGDGTSGVLVRGVWISNLKLGITHPLDAAALTVKFPDVGGIKQITPSTINLWTGSGADISGRLLTEYATTASHQALKYTSGLVVGERHILWAEAKANGREWVRLEISGIGGGFFHLTDAGSSSGVDGGLTADIDLIDEGYYRISLVTSYGTIGLDHFVRLYLSPDGNSFVYLGDGSSGIDARYVSFAEGIVSGLQLPALTQQAALTASSLEVSSPVLGAPALAEIVDLSAAALTVGSPNIGVKPSIINALPNATGVDVFADVAADPYGGSTADRVEETISGSSYHFIYSNQFALIADPVVLWADLKANGRDWVYLQCTEAGAGGGTYINLATGALGQQDGSLTSRTVIDLGSGWKRVILGFTAIVQPDFAFNIMAASADGTNYYAGDGSSGFLIANVGVQYGTVPDFGPLLGLVVPLTAAALTVGSPHVGGIKQLVPTQITGWTTQFAGVVANTGTGPNGPNTADKLYETASGPTQHGVEFDSVPVNSGETITVWTEFSPDGRFWIMLLNYSDGAYCFYNWQSGQVGTHSGTTSQSMDAIGGGYYRCSMTVEVATNQPTIALYLATNDDAYVYTGDGSSGIFVGNIGVARGTVAGLQLPALTQQHSLTASPLEVSSPVLDAPTLAEIHALTAAALAVQSPVLPAISLAGEIVLTAAPLTVESPVLSGASLTQQHALDAADLATTSPVLGAASFSQAHTLDAIDLTVTSPVIDPGSLSQQHALIAADLATTSPVLGAPAISTTSGMVPVALEVSAPVLGAPAIVANSILLGDPLIISAPVLGAPEIGQHHVLSPQPLAVGSPVLGALDMGVAGQMAPVGIVVGSPQLPALTLAQHHELAGSALVTASPVLDAPVMIAGSGMIPAALTTGAPVIAAAEFGQLHALSAAGLTVGAPEFTTPVFGWVLVAADLTTQSVLVGAPVFAGIMGLVVLPPVIQSPQFGAPIFLQTHALTAASLAVSALDIGAPSTSSADHLIATALTVSPLDLGAPTLAQAHALTADGLTVGSPVLPAVGMDQRHTLLPAGLIVTAPVLPAVTLGQEGVIAAVHLAISSPVLGAPALGQHHVLAPDHLLNSAPALGAPAIAQTNVLIAADLTVGSPVFGLVAQIGELFAPDITIGSPTFGAPGLRETSQIVLLRGSVSDITNLIGSASTLIMLKGRIMTKTNQRVAMWRGDSRTIRVTIIDKTADQLIGAVARWALATSAAATTALVEKDSLSGGITITGNVIDVDLLPGDTEDLSPGAYYHELEIVMANGDVATALTGQFVLKDDLIVRPEEFGAMLMGTASPEIGAPTLTIN